LKKITFLLFISLFSGIAHGQCEGEKQEADKWNAVLKNKVSEWARDHHRQAKRVFLDCLRKQNKIVSQSPTSSPVSIIPNKRQYTNRFKRRYKTENVRVSDYTNFTGKKKSRWYTYFSDSPQCRHNSGNMQVFVACAKVRKHSLDRFNRRWNDITQQLNPLLDEN
jgi:hypothetical protein